jgi:hypothetical protein
MVFLLAIMSGCNRGKESVAKSQVPAVTASTAVASTTSGEQDAGLSLSIDPDSPITGERLLAVSSKGLSIESYLWEINNQIIEGETSSSLPPGLARKGDTVAVIAKAQGREARATVQIANTPPKIVELPFTPADFYQGIDITVTPRVVDPDDDPVNFDFIWSINDEVLPGEKGESLSGNSFRRGDRIALQVIPFDSIDHGEPFQSRAVVVPNAPPDIVSTPPVNFKSRVYQYQVRAEDRDGDSLSYVLEAAPAGMTINQTTGLVVWPIESNQSGEHKVKIVVLDEILAKAFQEYNINISLTEQATN